MPDFSAIARSIGSIPKGEPAPVGGGCIHQSFRWGSYFIKTNSSDQAANFQAEAEGLGAIKATGTIRVPEVVTQGQQAGTAFLVMEHLELRPSGDESLLGEQLAALHAPSSSQFGFPDDNFIGSTPQANRQGDSWPLFFRDQRLAPLLSLLEQRGIAFPETGALLERTTKILPKSPEASLLHGDLWSGNKAFLPDGSPVIFDPACYYGDASCDLAMTSLFGGYGDRFYDAYRSSSKLDEPPLHDFYNLYHLLNHAIIFGGGYVTQAHQSIRRFI